MLAGDWTDTGLPATIEGAVRSGDTAAALALQASGFIVAAHEPARPRRISPTVEGAIRAATDALLAEQRPDGHWVFELEADATIPAEYVLLVHYLAETPNLELERKIGVYLRRIQGAHGGWPLFHGGAFDISATVKAYFALKMIGDDIDAPHMARAREAIHARGGAIKANVFTRILLALYGQTAWTNVPTVPVELILLPRWFPDPSVQDELLGAHGDRAAAGAGGEEAAGAQSARRACARTVRARRAGGVARARRIRAPAGRPSSARSTGA